MQTQMHDLSLAAYNVLVEILVCQSSNFKHNDTNNNCDRHWQTANAVLEVCTQTTFGDGGGEPVLLNCAEVPKNTSPGPVTVTLPPGDNLDVVIVARNLVDANGDAGNQIQHTNSIND